MARKRASLEILQEEIQGIRTEGTSLRCMVLKYHVVKNAMALSWDKLDGALDEYSWEQAY